LQLHHHQKVENNNISVQVPHIAQVAPQTITPHHFENRQKQFHRLRLDETHLVTLAGMHSRSEVDVLTAPPVQASVCDCFRDPTTRHEKIVSESPKQQKLLECQGNQ